MSTDKQLLALGKQVLALVKKAAPGAEAAVSLAGTHRSHTRFARNQLTTAGENDELDLSLHVQLGLRSATADLNQLDPAGLERLVERTLASARLAPELPETMPLVGAQKLPAARLFDPSLASLPPIERAAGIAGALEPSRRADLVSAGYLQVLSGALARLTSAGFTAVAPFTDAEFSVTARTKDGTGSGWAGASTRWKADLDLGRIGQVAAEKAVASAKPKALAPGRYTVILEPAATTELLEFLLGSLDRRATDEGRSPYAGEPKPVGSKLITLRSDPASKETPMLPWDGEGLPRTPRTWVEQGELRALRVSRYWAKKQGLAPTGHYDGAALVPGSSTRAQLLAGVKRGVLITRFWYTNVVDPKTLLVTGLTRDGTFLVEDGAVVGPVKNFRFNQSVLDALRNVDAVGDDPTHTWTTWSAPSLRTHEFLLASTSDAV